MSRPLKITCSLLNSWLYATSEDADEEAFTRFLSALERKPLPKTKAMQEGISFENAITDYLHSRPLRESYREAEFQSIVQIGNKLRGAQLQVRVEKPLVVDGQSMLLVGVADALKAGVITDIKRVQRYEYGKYQGSTQHPMYLELLPEAYMFRYLIFDGSYLYVEEYRRGAFPPISYTISEFLRYLQDAHLMNTYQQNWRVNNGI